jgi:hypothetical protein
MNNELNKISDEEKLNVVFNLMPNVYARYLLWTLHRVGNRVVNPEDRVSGNSPMDTWTGTAAEFATLVKDSDSLCKLIFKQFQFLEGFFQGPFDMETVPGQCNGFPTKGTNALLTHLFPLIQRSKSGKVVTVAAEAVEQATPVPKRARESVRPTSVKRPATATRGNTTVCYNCHLPGHRHADCEFQCKRCPLKVGEKGGHFYRDCPKQEVKS